VGLFQLALGFLEFGNIDGCTMNEPGRAIVALDHLGFALKPDHATVARQHSIDRTQRLAGQKNTGRFHAPTIFVVGVNLLIPTHRIVEPLFLFETERRLDLRADVSLALAAVEVGHENHGWYLLNQGAVLGLEL